MLARPQRGTRADEHFFENTAAVVCTPRNGGTAWKPPGPRRARPASCGPPPPEGGQRVSPGGSYFRKCECLWPFQLLFPVSPLDRSRPQQPVDQLDRAPDFELLGARVRIIAGGA